MEPAGPDLDKAAAALEEMHARILTAQDLAPDEATRQQLQALGTLIGDNKSKVVDECRKTMADLDQRIDKAKQAAEAALQRTQEKKAKLEAAAAQGPPRPPAPDKPPPIDPNLSRDLRQELLDRYGKPGGSQPVNPDQELWKYLEGKQQ